MARWRLTAGHYLNVPGTEIEFKETDRDTGKQVRKVYPVPLYLNPDHAQDQNYPGEIVVCHVDKGQGKDIEFIGEPTADMEPMDDEARAISDSLRHKWIHPMDSLSPSMEGDYSALLIKRFEDQMAKLLAGQQTPVAVPSVDSAALAKLQDQVALLMEQNAALMAKVADPEPLTPSRRA